MTRILYRKYILPFSMKAIHCFHSFAQQCSKNILSFFLNLMLSFLWDRELGKDKTAGSESTPILHFPKCYQTAFWKGFNNFIFYHQSMRALFLISLPAAISVHKVFLPKFCQSIRKSYCIAFFLWLVLDVLTQNIFSRLMTIWIYTYINCLFISFIPLNFLSVFKNLLYIIGINLLSCRLQRESFAHKKNLHKYVFYGFFKNSF